MLLYYLIIFYKNVYALLFFIKPFILLKSVRLLT